MARAIEQLKQAMEACELGALSLPDQIDALMDAGKSVLQEMSTLTPPNEALTCRGCMYLPDCPSGIHCYGCARLYTDNYRRPPEGEANETK